MPGFEGRHKNSDVVAERSRRPVRERRFSLPHSGKSLTIFAAFTRAMALGARAPMFKDAILWL